MKYLRINITKEMKVLHSENYKTLLKEIKKDINKRKHPMFMDGKTILLKCQHYPRWCKDSTQIIPKRQ